MILAVASFSPNLRSIALAAVLLVLGAWSAGCASDSDETGIQACGPGFATSVVSVRYGANAGFGQDRMPSVVIGAPHGAGTLKGSTDVVSLGVGGEIVLGFAGSGIEDGPGPDFIVFENAFHAGGDPARPFVDPGEVSVSEDGASWTTFSCQADAPPYAGCAGGQPVFSEPANGISALDPAVAGGDAFDLASLGLKRARYVRIVDRAAGGTGTSAGFDLDAVGVIHAACP